MTLFRKNFKKAGILIFPGLFILILTPVIFASGQGLAPGETIPNPEILIQTKYDYDQRPRPVRIHDYKAGKNMLVAFMPDISEANSYANVMTTAFDTYFAEALAFVKDYNYSVLPGELKVLVITCNDEARVIDYLRKFDLDFDMVSDPNLDIAHFFGITEWNSGNEGSFVYIVDRENRITYANYDYRGEGEKLKTVQQELFNLYNIAKNNPYEYNEFSPLMAGDKARDFEFEYIYTGPPTAGFKKTEKGTLSGYKGSKNVLIAFYPAPYSMSCAMEVTKFNSYAEDNTLQKIINSGITENNDLEILMVSHSNWQILSKWNNELGLNNILLVNDDLGEISAKYSSYSPSGYNKRTLFLINKQGNVSYIDWDYQVNEEDFALVKEQINSLN